MRRLIIDLILFMLYAACTVLSAIELHMNHNAITLASTVIISVVDGLYLGFALNGIKEIIYNRDRENK